jgi:hypothetical protein
MSYRNTQPSYRREATNISQKPNLNFNYINTQSKTTLKK